MKELVWAFGGIIVFWLVWEFSSFGVIHDVLLSLGMVQR